MAAHGSPAFGRIEPRWIFTDVRHAAIAFRRELQRRLPDQVTTSWRTEQRGECVFFDYNQIARDVGETPYAPHYPKMPGEPKVGAALARSRPPEIIVPLGCSHASTAAHRKRDEP